MTSGVLLLTFLAERSMNDRRRGVIIKTSMLFFLLIGVVEAAEPNCVYAGSSQEIFECSRVAGEGAARAVTLSYKDLLNRIKMQYVNDTALGIDFSKLVASSQKYWKKLVEEDCRMEAFDIETGTQAYETTINRCVARKSLDRSAYLDSLVQ
ncbi:lysozyme inhibitor LprI family protein [Burkholderia ubonensis]|uniref:lysozyme inhibitor LprI family protein n=2 Tax=Burkholderia ubonensis TaxID=101571 RepID=UPI001626757B|nr:lysozyme inhibitor LprI family protein [Burkholderia ubonensis]